MDGPADCPSHILDTYRWTCRWHVMPCHSGCGCGCRCGCGCGRRVDLPEEREATCPELGTGKQRGRLPGVATVLATRPPGCEQCLNVLIGALCSRPRVRGLLWGELLQLHGEVALVPSRGRQHRLQHDAGCACTARPLQGSSCGAEPEERRPRRCLVGSLQHRACKHDGAPSSSQQDQQRQASHPQLALQRERRLFRSQIS